MAPNDKIQMVLEWADSEEAPSDWDTTFIKSLERQLEVKGYLTDGQEEALDNIIDKWHI